MKTINFKDNLNNKRVENGEYYFSVYIDDDNLAFSCQETETNSVGDNLRFNKGNYYISEDDADKKVFKINKWS